MSYGGELREAILEARELKREDLPTELRRCLRCDHWMRSVGAEHRICNKCKDPYHAKRWSRVGGRVSSR